MSNGIVYVFGMRHGPKDPTPGADALLKPQGVDRVRASAGFNLKDVAFHFAYASEQIRAMDTAKEALDALSQAALPVEVCTGFGYAWGCAGNEGIADVEKQIKATGLPETAGLWLTMSQSSLILRGQVKAALCLVSEAAAKGRGFDAGPINIFVASHSPTIELATPTPWATARLGEGDICKYTIEVTDGRATIKSAEVLKAPVAAPAPAPTTV